MPKLYPSYLNLTEKDWQKEISQALKMLASCNICPRNCQINRLRGESGFCQLKRLAVISSFHPHHGEEACLVGSRGSGTIFFAHCNLACQYCQNYDISQLDSGQEVEKENLAEAMITLQQIGCHNINFVSPTPNVPQILEALPLAIKIGLKVPLVYNCGGYDSIETLKLLDGIIDIYMPDAKYADKNFAQKYSLVSNYPEIMKKAIKEMYQQVGDLEIDDRGVAKKGLLVRHLVLPNNLAGTEKIMDFLAKEISKNTFVNIMAQYRPVYKANKFPEINRPITFEEFKKALQIARQKGLKRAYHH